METSRLPSGAHAASRAFGTRAHTDSVQPAGTVAWRGSSNGGWARSGSTCTVTGTRPAGASAVGAGGCVELVESVEQAAISTTPASVAAIRLRRSQTRMHLPDQNLHGFSGRDALTAGCGEPHRIAFMQRPCALEHDFTAGDEQVKVGSLRQFDAVTWLQARAVQRRVAVADRDGGVAAVFGYARRDRHQPAAQQLVVDLELLVAGR